MMVYARDHATPHLLAQCAGHQIEVEIPTVFLRRFENVKAWPEFIVLSGSELASFNQARYRAPSLPTIDAAGECAEHVNLIGGNRNFGHHIFESLTRLAVLDRLNELHVRPLAFWRDVPAKWVEEFIPATGIPLHRIVRVDPGRFTALTMPSCPIGRTENKTPFIWPDAIAWLRARFMTTTRKPPSRKLFLRRAAQWRNIANIDEVLELLRRHDYETVDLEPMSLIRQIHTVGEAVSIVMPAGSGSPITIWADSGATILELSNEHMDGIFGARLYAAASNIMYLSMRGQSVPTPAAKVPRDSDYRIEPDHLAKALRFMDQRIGASVVSASQV